ncbi:hypothetical protein [Streptomyces sp. AD55]|uniref:hypothetical protein n=1 Tax=Streptomyces sp. AD55 TaxID=3242895 RepID=UPI003527592D
MTNHRQERRTLAAVYAGLVLTGLVAITPYADRATTHLLADHIRAGYPAYDQARVDSAVTAYLLLLTVVGVLGVLAWLGTAWAVRTDKPWARPAATVLFVLGAGVALAGLLTRDTSGDTGLPPALGWAGTVPCLAGAVVLTQLWRRPRTA